ncbi:MAG: hypothetical protein ABL921_23360, partial [Pirellula sp.]
MKSFARRIANSIKQCVRAYHQRMRRRAFEKSLFQVFQRLETRRVLSVSADFGLVLPGVLNISIARGGNTDAGLFADGNEFFVDQDGNQTRDVGEVSGLLQNLTQINVHNAGRPGVGTFLWRGDFSQSNSLNSLMVSGLVSTTVAATANIAQD